jgi:hypothetical protein
MTTTSGRAGARARRAGIDSSDHPTTATPAAGNRSASVVPAYTMPTVAALSARRPDAGDEDGLTCSEVLVLGLRRRYRGGVPDAPTTTVTVPIA